MVKRSRWRKAHLLVVTLEYGAQYKGPMVFNQFRLGAADCLPLCCLHFSERCSRF
jgi:hypothetical protein